MDHAIASMRARGHERAVSHLYRHLAIFAVVITFLIAVDISTGPPIWVHWVVLGWGAGLGLHAFLISRENRSTASRVVTPPATDTLKARPPEPLSNPPFETPDSIP